MSFPGSQYMSDFINTASDYAFHYSSKIHESCQTGSIWYVPPALIGGYLAFTGSLKVGYALVGQERIQTRLDRLKTGFLGENIPLSKRASEITQAFIGPANLRQRTYIAAKGALRLAGAAAIIYPFFLKDKKLEPQFEMNLGDIKNPEKSNAFIQATISGNQHAQTLKSAQEHFTENGGRQGFLFQRGLQTPTINHGVVDAAEQVLNRQSETPVQDGLFQACKAALGNSSNQSCSLLKPPSQGSLFSQGADRTFAHLDEINQACNSTLQFIKEMPQDADLQRADTAKTLCDYTIGWIKPEKCDELHQWISPKGGNSSQEALTDFVRNHVCEPLQRRAELDLKLQQFDQVFTALDVVGSEEQAAREIIELSQLDRMGINPLKQFSERDPGKFVELSCRFLNCDASESISTTKMIKKAIKNMLSRNHPDSKGSPSSLIFSAADNLKSIFEEDKSLYELAPTKGNNNQTLNDYYTLHELWSKLSDNFKMPTDIVESTPAPDWTLNEDAELPAHLLKDDDE